MIPSNKQHMIFAFSLFSLLSVTSSFIIIGDRPPPHISSHPALLSNNGIYQRWDQSEHQLCSISSVHSRRHLNAIVKLGSNLGRSILETDNKQGTQNRIIIDEDGVKPRRAIYVGNIDWKIPQERIYEVILQIFRQEEQQESTSTKQPTLQVTRDQIKIKPKTNKKRDDDKLHGGSLIISFDNENSAQFAMDILQSSVLGKDSEQQQTHDLESTLNSKSNIHIRWSFKEEKKQSGNDFDKTSHRHNIEEEAFIQHRKKRALQYRRQRQKIAEKTDALISKLIEFVPRKIDTLNISGDNGSQMDNGKPNSCSSSSFIDWSAVPEEIDPMRGGKLKVNSNRGFRKQAQVEAFLHVLQNALLDCRDEVNRASGSSCCKELKVADLGCGGGNLSLPLAWFFKQENNEIAAPSSPVGSNISAQVIAVDINKHALQQLSRRAKDIGLSIETVEEDLLNLISTSESQIKPNTNSSPLKSCSAIVSLHACGAASDLAIEVAVSNGLPFAISPCCIGKTKSVRSLDRLPSLSTERGGAPDGIISYPRSKALSSMLRRGKDDEIDDYSLILSAADYSMRGSKHEQLSPNLKSANKTLALTEQEKAFHRRGRMAKLIVETDRLTFAEEQGYSVRMMELPGLGAHYPKRELLLGAKRGTLQAHRISSLSSQFSTQLRAKHSDDDEYSSTTIDDYDTESDDTSKISDQMDLGGFSKYLLPYTLAFFGSLAVTAAFFKFVLMDY